MYVIDSLLSPRSIATLVSEWQAGVVSSRLHFIRQDEILYATIVSSTIEEF